MDLQLIAANSEGKWGMVATSLMLMEIVLCDV